MANAPSINELKDLFKRKMETRVPGYIVAQVQDSSGLAQGLLRVYRTDTREVIIIKAQRFKQGVWLNLLADTSGRFYVDSVNAERTAEVFPDAMASDATQWLARNMIQQQWKAMKDAPMHTKRLALETMLLTALKMLQSPEWEQIVQDE